MIYYKCIFLHHCE